MPMITRECRRINTLAANRRSQLAYLMRQELPLPASRFSLMNIIAYNSDTSEPA